MGYVIGRSGPTMAEPQEVVLLLYGDGGLYGASMEGAALRPAFGPPAARKGKRGQDWGIYIATVPFLLAARLALVGLGGLNGGFPDGFAARRAAMEADPSLAARVPRALGGEARAARGPDGGEAGDH